jgi:hypothetical protein
VGLTFRGNYSEPSHCESSELRAPTLRRRTSPPPLAAKVHRRNIGTATLDFFIGYNNLTCEVTSRRTLCAIDLLASCIVSYTTSGPHITATANKMEASQSQQTGGGDIQSIKIAFSNEQQQTSNANHYDPSTFEHKPRGPQLWAIVLTFAAMYYLWTRILGRSIPFFAPHGSARGGHRISSSSGSIIRGKGHSQAEMMAARERQQERLANAAKAREMVATAKGMDGGVGGGVRERGSVNINATNTTTSSKSTNISQLQQSNQHQALLKQKQQALEEKKKKQRALYLKQKALREKEEEERRKDEELGPGWRYREDPSAVTAANGVLGGMDPQAGSGGGGYKGKSCTRRGG